jgi:5-methylcytosine-specific restriction endonuclease McrA
LLFIGPDLAFSIENAQTNSNNGSMDAATDTVSSCRALLLNSSYEPMNIISWQKAILLWFQGKVEVVEFHEIFARSIRHSFKIPSVMRLKTYVRPRSYGAVRFCRENIYIRDNFTCQYCGEKISPKNLTLDHVIPVSKAGPKSWTNVVAACRTCNQRKADRTPETARMPLLKQPSIPAWLPLQGFHERSHVVPMTWLQYLRFER